MLRTEAGCHEHSVWGSLAKGLEHSKAWGCLLAARDVQQLKEPWMLGEEGSEEVTWVGRVVFIRLLQIQIWC